MRTMLAFALACLLALGLAACGGGDGETSSSATESEELSGTVTVWDTEYKVVPEYTEAIEQIDADFEKLHPKVTIDRQAKPFEGYEALARAAFTAGEGPDLMWMQIGEPGVLSFTKGLEVLNDRLDPQFQEEVTQWESATPGYTEEGDRYGVPIGMIGFVFYYNKELFGKAGLPTDFEPKSWDEIRETGEKLKAAGVQPFTGGNKEGWETQWWFSMGFQTESTPEQMTELANGEMAYTDEAIAKGFGPLIEMEEAGLYPENRASTPTLTEGFASFAEGKGAMILGLWNQIGYWGEFNPKLGEENVGIFFPPWASGEVETYASSVMSIPTFADNKEAATAFLEYELGEKGAETLANVGGMMPNRVDAKPAAGAPSQARELLAAAAERKNVMAPAGMIPASVYYGPMVAEMGEVLAGRTSLESAQEAMQETYEKTEK